MRLVLASTSPQRRAILEQLRIPFDVAAPAYEEHDPPDADPVKLVRRARRGQGREHPRSRGTGRSASTRRCTSTDGSTASPRTTIGARAMLAELSGRTHQVVSGVCLLGPGVRCVEDAITHVTFRPADATEIERYVASGEWEGRAGSYAIQGLGARLVAGIDGDYLNVVGLPAALLIGLLAAHAPALLAS